MDYDLGVMDCKLEVLDYQPEVMDSDPKVVVCSVDAADVDTDGQHRAGFAKEDRDSLQTKRLFALYFSVGNRHFHGSVVFPVDPVDFNSRRVKRTLYARICRIGNP